jgi:tryptophan-rich sensory protein
MENPQKKKEDMVPIVSVNLVLTIIYTLIVRFNEDERNGIWEITSIMIIHIVLCVIIAPFFRTRSFLLSALAVLLVGFSTCVISYTVH